MKSALRLLLPFPAILGLVSWSPSDPTVIAGANNDTDGHIETGMNITIFRGLMTGTGNKVGSASSDSRYASVTGNYNNANLYSSVLAGELNQIALTADAADLSTFVRHSGIFGNSNWVANGSVNLLVSGYSNSVTANTSIVVGGANTVSGAVEGSKASNSMAIGNLNQIAASQGWTVGTANTVTGTGGVAIGSGLTSSNSASIALGKWNASMASDDLLVVGRGTSSSNLGTALTIKNNGAVIIPGAVTISGAANLQGATAQTLTVSGNVALQGTTTAQNLTVSGNSTLQGSITALDLTATGAATLASVSATSLSVSGTSSLSATSATTLTSTGATTLADTTAESLTVSGITTLQGATVLQGTVTLAQSQGDISMGIYGE